MQRWVFRSSEIPHEPQASRSNHSSGSRPVIDDLTLEVSAGYDDAKFTQTVPGVLFRSGDRVPQVPRESAQFDANYKFTISSDVSGFAHADYRYVGNSWSTNNAVTNPNTGVG